MSFAPAAATLSRMNADSFIVLALEAAGVLALAVLVLLVLVLGSHGPELDA
jgi:hypothetical protein